MKNIWVYTALFIPFFYACQETRLQPKAPAALTGADGLSGEAQQTPENSQDASGNSPGKDATADVDEAVTPPAPITGAYLTGTVLLESTVNSNSTAKIGLVTYYKGKKVSADPSRYTVSFTAAYTGASPGISISTPASDTAGYDRMVTVSGPNVPAIRNAYASTMMYLTIVDNVDYSSETIEKPMSSALTSVQPKQSQSTNTTTTTTTTTSVNGANGANGANGGNGNPP